MHTVLNRLLKGLSAETVKAYSVTWGTYVQVVG